MSSNIGFILRFHGVSHRSDVICLDFFCYDFLVHGMYDTHCLFLTISASVCSPEQQNERGHR